MNINITKVKLILTTVLSNDLLIEESNLLIPIKSVIKLKVNIIPKGIQSKFPVIYE
tara:strand:- start:436 stop:603 length:168 start_codon:yes stop_codon:yes gene_type:complete